MHGIAPHGSAVDPAEVTLTDGLVMIRPLNRQDASSLFEANSESLPQLCAWLTWCRSDHELDHCVGFILKSQADWQKGEQFNFGIFDAKTDELVGSIALNQIN